MILNTPDYKKAIDEISKVLREKKVTGQLEKDLVFMRAGLTAEKEMAYRLGSYFQNSPELFVWNNLKLTHGGTNTQIDHLVFSRRAFWIIESKSVSDAIEVNEHGEFSRKHRGKSSGMNSPIEQVKQQQHEFLEFMKANRKKFLGTKLGMQKGLSLWTPTIFVAISEQCKIEGQGRANFKKELRKFDQIASEIDNVHKSVGVGLIESIMKGKPETMNLFSEKELENFKVFLKRVNIAEEPYERLKKLVSEPRFKAEILAKPETKKAVSAKQVAAKAGCNEFACGKCGSKNLAVAFGRSYYFKCKDCDGNTPIHLVCPQCKGIMKTRKQEDEFFKCCEKCGTNERYFVNKEA
jgi:hypothetical protein